MYLKDFKVISGYFVTQIFRSYIFMKFLWKNYKDRKHYIYIKLSRFLSNLKDICYLDFCVLIYSRKLSEKFMKTKILYLSDFSKKFNLSCYLNFLNLYIHKNILKENMKVENIAFIWFLSRFKLFWYLGPSFLYVHKVFLKDL